MSSSSLCWRLPLNINPLPLARLENVLQVLDKYGVTRVPLDITQQLIFHIDNDPVRTCAVACRYSLHDVANQAAKATCRHLALDITKIKPDYLSLMSIDQYQSLIKYRLRASEVAADAVETFPTLEDVDRDAHGSLDIYVPGTRMDTTSCGCTESIIAWPYGELDFEDAPVYMAPWLQTLKKVFRYALYERPDWDTVSEDGMLVMQVVKAAVDAKCTVCMGEVLKSPWVLERMGRRVKERIGKVSLAISDALVFQRKPDTQDPLSSQIPLPFQAPAPA